MEAGIIYRKGTPKDIHFITNAIIIADSGIEGFTIYEKLFDLSKQEVSDFIFNALEEDAEGCEFSCSSFIIAEKNNTPVGCIASWIEGSGSRSGNNIKAFIFARILGIDKWKSAQEKLKTTSVIDIHRTPGALQIESCFVKGEHRGIGIFSGCIKSAIASCSLNDFKVQVLTMSGNKAPATALAKLGFEIKETRLITDEYTQSLVPGKGRILWEKTIVK